MSRAISIAAALLLALASCSGAKKPAKRGPFNVPDGTEDIGSDLVRDLEATVLENYSQLTLNNHEAYMDSLAQDLDLAMIGLGADDVMVGPGPRSSWVEQRPYHERRGVRLFSKNLQVHLAADSQVGWTSDEISYRVPLELELGGGARVTRVASIPIRATAAFVRDIGRWVMVAEHLSYALPARDIVDLARRKKLRWPKKLPAEGDIDEETADKIADAVLRFHRRGEAREEVILADGRSLIILPDPDGEYAGKATLVAPGLSGIFDGRVRVEVTSSRVSARVGRTAWMIANLRVTTGRSGDRVSIPMRGSYIVEARKPAGDWAWIVVQAHISVPLEQSQLDERVFGQPETPAEQPEQETASSEAQ